MPVKPVTDSATATPTPFPCTDQGFVHGIVQPAQGAAGSLLSDGFGRFQVAHAAVASRWHRFHHSASAVDSSTIASMSATMDKPAKVPAAKGVVPKCHPTWAFIPMASMAMAREIIIRIAPMRRCERDAGA